MKKIGLGILIVVVILSISGIAAARPDGVGSRYFIGSDSGVLRAITGVQHNFDNGYTANLTYKQLKVLERLSIEVSEVALYHISKPACNNDGICDSDENPSCADCKKEGEEEPDPSRTCDPSNQLPWGIEMINGGSGGPGIDVDVAVLDTGVYRDHLDLSNRVEQCKDFTKGPRIKNGCKDGNGHGTHVSGTILADGGSDGKGIYGVAPEADLFAYKVCGDGGSCWSDDIASAIMYASDQGAEIISMSLSGDTESSLIRDAIDYAVGGGVLVVAAAGNDGPAFGSIDYPGANVKVIAVGAINSGEQVPDFSSRGENDGDYIIEEREVEFGAPGVLVESSWNNGCYYEISGTSMATPHISGLAAKLWKGSATSTRNYLQSIARDIGEPGDDPATGFGLPVAP